MCQIFFFRPPPEMGNQHFVAHCVVSAKNQNSKSNLGCDSRKQGPRNTKAKAPCKTLLGDAAPKQSQQRIKTRRPHLQHIASPCKSNQFSRAGPWAKQRRKNKRHQQPTTFWSWTSTRNKQTSNPGSTLRGDNERKVHRQTSHTRVGGSTTASQSYCGRGLVDDGKSGMRNASTSVVDK